MARSAAYVYSGVFRRSGESTAAPLQKSIKQPVASSVMDVGGKVRLEDIMFRKFDF